MHLGHTYSAFGHGATAIIFFLFSFFLSRSLLPVFRLSPSLLFAGDKNKNESVCERERAARFGASTAARGKHSSNFMHPPRYCATRGKRGDWGLVDFDVIRERGPLSWCTAGCGWLTFSTENLGDVSFSLWILDKKRRIHFPSLGGKEVVRKRWLGSISFVFLERFCEEIKLEFLCSLNRGSSILD